MASLKTIIRKLKEGHRVLVFPEGARTLDGNLGEAAPGIGLIAAKSGAVIQPVRIRGAREALPRGSARIHFARITVRKATLKDVVTPVSRSVASRTASSSFSSISGSSASPSRAQFHCAMLGWFMKAYRPP